MDIQTATPASEAVSAEDASLLKELDKLEVIEADELQEGVAFFAFRFVQ